MKVKEMKSDEQADEGEDQREEEAEVVLAKSERATKTFVLYQAYGLTWLLGSSSLSDRCPALPKNSALEALRLDTFSENHLDVADQLDTPSRSVGSSVNQVSIKKRKLTVAVQSLQRRTSFQVPIKKTWTESNT